MASFGSTLRERWNGAANWLFVVGAVAVGAATGLIWGVAARVWMRLIAPNPEFSVGGTVFIVLVAVVFGSCAGLAFAARQRGFVAWRHSVPQAACVLTFIPFGAGGGAPLMLNVLLATLALTRSSVAIIWTIACLAVLLGTVGGGPVSAAFALLPIAFALTAWKSVGSRSNEKWVRVDWWVERVVRIAAVLLSAAAFVIVCVEVVKVAPGLLAPVYILYYALLLVPLFFGLRIGLSGRVSATPSAHPSPAPAGRPACPLPSREREERGFDSLGSLHQ